MEHFDIRGAIAKKLQGLTQADLRGTIEDSIKSGEEKLLPGLGVIFELIWNSSTEAEQQTWLSKLHTSLT